MEMRDAQGLPYFHLVVAWSSGVRLWQVGQSQGGAGLYAVETKVPWTGLDLAGVGMGSNMVDEEKVVDRAVGAKEGGSRIQAGSGRGYKPRGIAFQLCSVKGGNICKAKHVSGKLVVWLDTGACLFGAGDTYTTLPTPVPGKRACGALGGHGGRELVAVSSGGEIRVYSPWTDEGQNTCNQGQQEGEGCTGAGERAGANRPATSCVAATPYRTVLCAEALPFAPSAPPTPLPGSASTLPLPPSQAQSPGPPGQGQRGTSEPFPRGLANEEEALIGTMRAMCAAGPTGFYGVTEGGFMLGGTGRRASREAWFSQGKDVVGKRELGLGLAADPGRARGQAINRAVVDVHGLTTRYAEANCATSSLAVSGGVGGGSRVTSGTLRVDARHVALGEPERPLGKEGRSLSKDESSKPVAMGGLGGSGGNGRARKSRKEEEFAEGMGDKVPKARAPTPAILDLRGKIGLGAAGAGKGMNSLLILPVEDTGSVSGLPLSEGRSDISGSGSGSVQKGGAEAECPPRLLYVACEGGRQSGRAGAEVPQRAQKGEHAGSRAQLGLGPQMRPRAGVKDKEEPQREAKEGEWLSSRAGVGAGQGAGAVIVEASTPLPHALTSPDLVAASAEGDMVCVGSLASNLVACYRLSHYNRTPSPREERLGKEK
ncbi:unnamed protein product, partial [Discosporangium mesarthrocarpum]